MLFRIAPLLVASALFSTALCRFDWSTNTGKTRLRGNSFGTGYVNATYDYVVSESSESRHDVLLI